MSLTGTGDDNEGVESPPVLPTDEYKPIDFSGGHAPFVVVSVMGWGCGP